MTHLKSNLNKQFTSFNKNLILNVNIFGNVSGVLIILMYNSYLIFYIQTYVVCYLQSIVDITYLWFIQSMFEHFLNEVMDKYQSVESLEGALWKNHWKLWIFFPIVPWKPHVNKMKQNTMDEWLEMGSVLLFNIFISFFFYFISPINYNC